MLSHLIGILCLASVSVADVPSRLFAISHLKGIIDELQETLVDFKKNMTQELTTIEKVDRHSLKNETSCLEQISHAHKASRKLLKMLFEGEYNGLATAEESMENMTLHEISQLWGELARGGKSRLKINSEMENFRGTAKARIIEAIKDCKTPANPRNNTTAVHQT